MKRLLVILLLLVLPMQIVWAGLDSYWPVQQAAGAQHQGHHVHDYAQSGAEQQGAGAATMLAGDDADCDYCHHGFCNILAFSYRFSCAPGRLDPPAAAGKRYQSFIADITHPPDI